MGALGLDFGLCRAKFKVTWCKDDNWLTPLNHRREQGFRQVEGLAKLAKCGFGALISDLEVSKGEVG